MSVNQDNGVKESIQFFTLVKQKKKCPEQKRKKTFVLLTFPKKKTKTKHKTVIFAFSHYKSRYGGRGGEQK